MSISFSILKEGWKLTKGRPIYCNNWEAVFNKYSKFIRLDDKEDLYIWNWEFWKETNEIKIDLENLPNKESISYLLDNENQMSEEKKVRLEEEPPIIFWIDISASMAHKDQIYPSSDENDSETSNLKTVQKFWKVTKNKSWSEIQSKMSKDSPIKASSSKISYISNAIIEQLSLIQKTKRRVGIVLFNDKIHILGDWVKVK